jgi:isoleucyl-tRNA synthetase
MNSLGADVLRLWVSATDYANEISVSDEILKRMAESYRRMRNTVRFLLGNLHGFDPERDAVKPAEMLALDRWALARTRELQSDIVDAYRQYAFHVIYQKVHNFCIVDLGGFYLDVLKDRLYTMPKHSHGRKSAQTAMYHIAASMVRWLAPILSFTAEEIWRFLPGKHADSVFLSTWHDTPEAPRDIFNWSLLMDVRNDVTRLLEKLRNEGAIGSALDAEVDVYCTSNASAGFVSEFEGINALGKELRFLLIVSEARVLDWGEQPLPDGAVQGQDTLQRGIFFVVKPSSAVKCVRCWQRRLDVGANPAHPQICGRCVTNVDGPGEKREFA